MQDTRVPGFSGTVVSHVSLGLPDMPVLDGTADDASFRALLAGSHTMQVWYGGPDRQRVALLGAMEETDLFRSGRDMWEWSSSDGVAVHTVVPARYESLGVPTSLTPADLARQVLRALDPTTRIRVEDDRTVADRSVYELVLTPRSAATKVGSVHIAVDGHTKVPLGVQVYPRGSMSAAIDVAFTGIRFAPQAARNFVFTPPPTARVRTVTAPVPPDSQEKASFGWTSVVTLAPGKAALSRYVNGAVLSQLTPVAGRWGSGRLLDAPLISVLITDDGRIYAGAVDPARLFAAASN